jgi:RNase H-like domain found in reverse transcriptase
MKQLVGGSEVLVPLDLRRGAPPIWVVADSSLSGGGGYIAQGNTLEMARPAVYHSRVFNPAQTNYPVYEQELLALEDIIKSYEHWLISRQFTAVTDSQAMLSSMKQKHLSPRKWRLVIYLSKFDITSLARRILLQIHYPGLQNGQHISTTSHTLKSPMLILWQFNLEGGKLFSISLKFGGELLRTLRRTFQRQFQICLPLMNRPQ